MSEPAQNRPARSQRPSLKRLAVSSASHGSSDRRYPVIYTSTNWWNQCANGDFSSTSPLWIARYASQVGTLPANWSAYTFWQYSDDPIDQNRFNGSYGRLRALAAGPKRG